MASSNTNHMVLTVGPGGSEISGERCTLVAMTRFGPLLAVAVGGMVGSLARWAVLGLADDSQALVVVGLNVFGSLLVGGLLGQRDRLADQTYALLATGFAGGLTTFSDFAVTVAQNLEQGALLSALANGLGTAAAAMVAAGVGFRLSKLAFIHLPVRRWRRRRRRARSSSSRRRARR